MANVTPTSALEDALKSFHIPDSISHKGENGRLLIIGGSSLFHAAVLWSAETASHFVDLVHFCSTVENNQIFLNLKTKFGNGIIVEQKNLDDYAREDDCILIGPGMVRGEGEEAQYTHDLMKRLIEKYPQKQFIIDAGAMQMMESEWLLKLEKKAIVTPHQKEFAMLFGKNIIDMTIDEKKKTALQMAKQYNCIILLKAIVDIVTDGETIVTIEGGNAGLTKGGTGDTLASLTASFSIKNDPLASCVLASFFLKKAAEELFKDDGYWFNTTELITHIPKTMKNSLLVDNLEPVD